MATKTLKKPVKEKEKSKATLPKMEYSCGQMGHCCGIAEIGGFEHDTGGYNWHTGKHYSAKLVHETKEEQAEACYKSFIEETGEEGYALLLLSLVTKYGKHDYAHHKAGESQWPEMEAILKREKWRVYKRFINPFHGNEVTLYGMYFDDRAKDKRHLDDRDDDYDDYGGDR